MIKNDERIYRFVLFFSKLYLKVVVSKLLPMLAGEKAVVRGGEAEVG